MQQTKVMAKLIVTYGALFALLYLWKVRDVDGAAHFIQAWCVLLFLVGLLGFLLAVVNGAKPLPVRGNGVTVLLFRAAFWTFALLLLWFGNWWLFASCVTYALGMSCYRFAAGGKG